MKIGKNIVVLFQREILTRRKFWRFDRGVWPHNEKWSTPIFTFRNFGPFQIRNHKIGLEP